MPAIFYVDSINTTISSQSKNLVNLHRDMHEAVELPKQLTTDYQYVAHVPDVVV